MTSNITPAVSGLSDTAAAVLFGGTPEDTFYEDLAYLRKLVDEIADVLPALPSDFAMSAASRSFAHTSCEPLDLVYPDFTVPAISGVTKEISA